jgi:hypothetical protein
MPSLTKINVMISQVTMTTIVCNVLESFFQLIAFRKSLEWVFTSPNLALQLPPH